MNIHEGLDSVLVLMENELRGRVEVVREYGDIPPIYCYPSELNQAFMHLVANASCAIDDEGTIRITTSHKDDTVRIAVSDTGRGIPAERLDSLFEFDFSQSDSRVKMGSGLVIVRNIIDRHKGGVTADSTVGRGSQFVVTLPTNLAQEGAA